MRSAPERKWRASLFGGRLHVPVHPRVLPEQHEYRLRSDVAHHHDQLRKLREQLPRELHVHVGTMHRATTAPTSPVPRRPIRLLWRRSLLSHHLDRLQQGLLQLLMS